MKKNFLIFFSILIFDFALADDSKLLQIRLNKIKSFHANFIHKIITSEGDIIQKGDGKLWIQRPKCFRLETISPDKNLIISDGNILWFYNPFIEQVTINWLKDIIDNTPFILILTNDFSELNQYNVRKKGDIFYIIPKFNNSNITINKFIIKVDIYGIIKEFTFFETDGQCSNYKFINSNIDKISLDNFKFTFNEKISIDDQRQ